jgi:hypothetical protein
MLHPTKQLRGILDNGQIICRQFEGRAGAVNSLSALTMRQIHFLSPFTVSHSRCSFMVAIFPISHFHLPLRAEFAQSTPFAGRFEP